MLKSTVWFSFEKNSCTLFKMVMNPYVVLKTEAQKSNEKEVNLDQSQFIFGWRQFINSRIPTSFSVIYFQVKCFNCLMFSGDAWKGRGAQGGTEGWLLYHRSVCGRGQMGLHPPSAHRVPSQGAVHRPASVMAETRGQQEGAWGWYIWLPMLQDSDKSRLVLIRISVAPVFPWHLYWIVLPLFPLRHHWHSYKRSYFHAL